MARVEEGSRDMERKRSSAGESGPREGESEAEWEKRKERYERKEKAKADEARRLKVIVRFRSGDFARDLSRIFGI